MEKYDIVIIGSGMGGLVCADILSKDGYKVCVIEKNKQIGGCLQTYVRDKVIFDSGVHYLGGLSKGQNLYQIFKYLGIIDKLKLQPLANEVFDKILIENDIEEYAFAQGYDNFIQTLLKYFPDEEIAIRKYCDKIKEVCALFPLYNLQPGGNFNDKIEALSIDTQSFMDSITQNQKLQAVLLGNNMLYVLQAHKTPFYVHAMILNSYIESSYKCIDGGSVIGKYLAENIRNQGGEILRNKEVVKLIVEDNRVKGVQLQDDTVIEADRFISNLHPARTFELTDSSLIKNVHRNRINQLENSIGAFIINIVLKKESFLYQKHNSYYHKEGRIWDMGNHNETDWPLCYALFFSASSKIKEYAESVTIIAYMKYSEVSQWETTFNTVSAEQYRGEDYDAFKKLKAEKVIDLVEERFPGLKSSIHQYYTATPLSYRDYIGNPEGAMYGIVKDSSNPMKSFISPKTPISNLYLTGQNLNLHGILGASMSGLVTCIEMLGSDAIIDKIRNA